MRKCTASCFWFDAILDENGNFANFPKPNFLSCCCCWNWWRIHPRNGLFVTDQCNSWHSARYNHYQQQHSIIFQCMFRRLVIIEANLKWDRGLRVLEACSSPRLQERGLYVARTLVNIDNNTGVPTSILNLTDEPLTPQANTVVAVTRSVYSWREIVGSCRWKDRWSPTRSRRGGLEGGNEQNSGQGWF